MTPRVLSAFALALVVAVATPACGIWGGSCDPGYDESWLTGSRCEGNELHETRSACGETEDTHVEDCGASGRVCIDGRGSCAVPCADDGDCSTDEYCRVPSGGLRVCEPRLRYGA